MELTSAVKALGKLLQLGITTYEAWTSPGFETKELETLPALIDLLGELRGGRPERALDMEALHLGVITRCFGQAFGRHWAFNQSLAPSSRGFWRFMRTEERKRAEEIELRMSFATGSLEELGRPGDLPAGEKEWRHVAALAGSPLGTPYYRALWNAFTDPKLDDEGGAPPLLDLGEAGRLEFERHFLLAYHQALGSPEGLRLRSYLERLSGDYRVRLLRELLLKDMASWSERHIFGNLERRAKPSEDPIPFMPLGEMYVEPDTRRTGAKEEAPTPIIEGLEHLLREPKKGVLVVKADFGMGKSLTARTLAHRWAADFLSARTPSPDLVLPLYIRCAEDLPDEGFDLEQTVRSAWKRQADALGLDLKASDEALSLPEAGQRAVFLLDGLDEVILGERRLESLFKRLKEEATERHRFIVFSRPGALPAEEELKGIPLLELLPWRREQSERWLERWRGLHDGAGPVHPELEARGLGELVATPILLFMVAQTWSQHSAEASTSRAALYEEFFGQIAQGKHALARERHLNVEKASAKLRDNLAGKGLLSEEAEAPDAMLWLMGRVAWEATKLEQRQMLEPLRKPLVLTRRNIENLIVEELGVEQNASDTIDAIQMGLLLTMQAHLRAGTASQILFGHKSFREYLVARYWADRLKALARSREKSWKDIERPLLGGRLLSREDRTFRFLMEMLNGESLPHRPHAPFGLKDDEHKVLLRWAQECFESEEQELLSSGAHKLREDWSPLLREAALAIGSSLRDSPGLEGRDKLTLRSMLAWFWLMRIGPSIVAPRGRFPGASMSDLTLRGADFREADLRDANFSRDILTPGHIAEGSEPTDFSGARLDRAILRATLDSVRFCRCSMEEADLTHASLVRADLTDARLHGANLKGANLTGAVLHGALYDHRTCWPEGFNPEEAGARRDEKRRR